MRGAMELISIMAIEVGCKFAMCIFDIMLNHSYLPIMKYVQKVAHKELCSKIISISPMFLIKLSQQCWRVEILELKNKIMFYKSISN